MNRASTHWKAVTATPDWFSSSFRTCSHEPQAFCCCSASSAMTNGFQLVAVNKRERNKPHFYLFDVGQTPSASIVRCFAMSNMMSQERISMDAAPIEHGFRATHVCCNMMQCLVCCNWMLNVTPVFLDLLSVQTACCWHLQWWMSECIQPERARLVTDIFSWQEIFTIQLAGFICYMMACHS